MHFNSNSLKFVPGGPIGKSALVQIMAWPRQHYDTSWTNEEPNRGGILEFKWIRFTCRTLSRSFDCLIDVLYMIRQIMTYTSRNIMGVIYTYDKTWNDIKWHDMKRHAILHIYDTDFPRRVVHLLRHCYGQKYGNHNNMQILKWLDTILAHSQNPRHPATLADTYLQITLMVTGIQNISYHWWNLQSFAFSITGALSILMSVRPLDLWPPHLSSHYTEFNYPKSHLTFLVMSYKDWVWTHVMPVSYVYNLADN